MDKIYIIEDDENIRNLLKIALEGFGYEAEGFETAEEGLERIKEEVPSLAIFDWMLPGMDGVTAIRKIRQTDGLQELPIMLLTAKEKELDKVVGLDCGADDYMVKELLFEGSNRYYDQALCTGLNITDEDIDALCKAMKEQAVKNAHTEGGLCIEQRIAVTLRTNVDCYHIFPPKMSHLKPIHCHGVDFAFILHGDHAPFIGNGFKNIKG